MSHPAILKLEAFLAKNPSPAQFESALPAVMGVFVTPQNRPPLSEYFSLLSHLKTAMSISFFSTLLDTYAPSFNATSLEKITFDWAFLSKVPPEKRDEDKAFFTKLWTACDAKKTGLTDPLREIVLASMFKYSGLTNEWQFGRALQAIEKKAGYIPFELLRSYENDAKELRPMTLVFNWLRLSVFAYGLSASVALLKVLCNKQDTEDYFDVARLWDEHLGILQEWRHMTYGEVLLETQKLAQKNAVSLPDIATLPTRMLFPLMALPESEDDDTDDDENYELPMFK
jgi:hypothetical protein